MQNIILTGVDGSKTATKAAEVAASLATDLKCDLHVISASDPKQVSSPRMGRLAGDPTAMVETTTYQKEIDKHNRATQKTAESVAEILREKFPDLNITSKGIHKSPAAALIEEAQKLDARFVVVGNKHVQGARRMLGSVATEVARHIKTDLYIAHTR